MTISIKTYAGFLAAMSLFPAAYSFELPRTSPEAQGIRSEKVIELLDSLTSIPQTEIHSLTLLRHGNIIAQTAIAPFVPEDQHELFSVSKTFTAAAVGLAIADNRLRLDDRLGAIIPEALPDSVSDWLADVNVRDLLTMTSGIKVDWGMRGRQDEWTKVLLSQPMASEPGEHFSYDSMSSYLLSAIVQKVAGRTVLDYLSERVFKPLEIKDYAWDVSPEGVTTGGWGLWMRPEDLAKFGQMLLDGGRWNGQQILPAEWVREMTSKKIDVPGTSNYCYQMWTCPHKGTVRADGAWGQYIIIMPEEDMVAVLTQCQQGVSDRVQALVWNTLTPTLSDTPITEGKPYRELIKKINRYSHPFPKGKVDNKTMRILNGRAMCLPSNPMGWKNLTIEKDGKDIMLIAVSETEVTDTISCGYREWKKSGINNFPPDERADTHNRFSGHTNRFFADAAFAWKADNTLEIKIHYTNWYSSLLLDLAPTENNCEVTFKLNYQYAPQTVEASWIDSKQNK